MEYYYVITNIQGRILIERLLKVELIRRLNEFIKIFSLIILVCNL